MSLIIRTATESDVDEVCDIWQTGSKSSLGLELPQTIDYAKEFADLIRSQDEVFRFYVAEDGHDIIGWSAIKPFRANPVVRDVMAELSAYVRPAKARTGVARTLIQEIIRHAQKTPLQYIMGFIATSNVPSLKMVESLGFQTLGVVPPTPKSVSPSLAYVCYVVPVSE